MGNHDARIEGAVTDLLQQLLPVLVHWGLTVSDEADTALHERADVEVVGLDGRIWLVW